MIPIIMVSTQETLHPIVAAFLCSHQGEVIHHVQQPEFFHPDEDANKFINIAKARTEAVRKAMRLDWEKAFLLDSDVVPPANVVDILDSRGFNCVGGWLPARKGGWVAGRFVGPMTFSFFEQPRPGFVETHLLSLGCVLVSRNLLCQHTFDPGVDRYCQDDQGNLYHLGDCGAFCNHVRDRGHKVYLDGEIICQHITEPCLAS